MSVVCYTCTITVVLFQSLFSWNLLLMVKKKNWVVTTWISFNPCFRGTCSWWKRLPSLKIEEVSFNPCFRGTCSWCHCDSLCPSKPSGFNPCFRGTCSWCSDVARCIMPVGIVSILVFVELALDVLLPPGTPSGPPSFNPCFRGTCSWWERLSTMQYRKAWVSILVFVELALDACP